MSVLDGRELLRARRRGRQVWLDLTQRLAAPTARLRAAAAPLTELLEPAACVVGAVALASAFGGWLLGWRELVVVAVFLTLLLVLAFAFIIGRHQLGARLDLSRDRVVVGERASGRLLIANRLRRRTLPLTVELPVGAGRADFDLPSLAGEEEHEELFVIPTSSRGVLTLGPVRAVRADPFFLLSRKQDLDEPQLLHVHPRTVPIDGSEAGIVNDLEGRTTRKLTNSDVSFHALRAYVPGDDRRYVHWKTTARTGKMMVRQFEETRRSHLLVFLSSRLDDYASQDEFELAVSTAGSLAVQCLRDGQTLSMATSTRALSTVSGRRVLDELSGVDFERQAGRLSSVTRSLAHRTADASIVVIVCGSLAQASEARSAARHFGVDVRTIVVQATDGAETETRRLGHLDMANLASLDHFPALARRLTR